MDFGILSSRWKGCLVLTNLSRNILTVYLAEFQDFPSDKEIFLWYHGNSTGLYPWITRRGPDSLLLKFMLFKKATKIEKIFTVDLTRT